MSARAALLATTAPVLLLSGCGATTSSITIEYTVGGANQTITLRPDGVTCSDDHTSGFSIGDPVGMFQFAQSSQPGGTPAGTVTISTSQSDNTKDLVQFETDVELPAASGDTVTIPKMTGVVVLLNGWDGESDFDRADGTEVDATVSGELICDAE